MRYASLPLALSLLGTLALSGVAAARVSNEAVERSAADRLVVSWADKAAVDVYAADSAEASVQDARLVSKANKKGRFEDQVGSANRRYYLLKDTADGSVVRVAERVLPLDRGSNFRDIGGYPAADGMHVRWGKLFRSGGTPLLTDADVATVQAVGIKDLVDLRSSEERVIAPTRLDGIRYTAVGYPMMSINRGSMPTSMSQVGDAYRNFPSMLVPQLRVLFHTMLAGDGPIAYNCSAGQDRTGFATALILTALGVPRDVVMADYHLSTTYRHPENEMPKIDATGQPENSVAYYFASLQKDGRLLKPQPLYDANRRALLEYAFDEINSRWGSVDAYLEKEIGVTKADIAKLRQKYLE